MINPLGKHLIVGIIKNKQYLVHPNDIIVTTRIGLGSGRCFYFKTMNMTNGANPMSRKWIGGDDVGKAQILKSLVRPKIKVLKFKRRKNYKRCLGHTQKQSELLVLSTNRLS